VCLQDAGRVFPGADDGDNKAVCAVTTDALVLRNHDGRSQRPSDRFTQQTSQGVCGQQPGCCVQPTTGVCQVMLSFFQNQTHQIFNAYTIQIHDDGT
jgi:hypothetical protein